MAYSSSRSTGALLGLALGDALGAPLEFKQRDTYDHIKGMASGGHFNLEAGTYTDDTAMALCLADSLIQCQGFNADDQMQRYVRWYLEGYMSATGKCIGMGKTTWRALRRFIDTGEHSIPIGKFQADGNGSLMRLAPIAMFYADDIDSAVKYAGLSSRTTHNSQEAEDACKYYVALLVGAINGLGKHELLNIAYGVDTEHQPNIKHVSRGSYAALMRSQVKATGYVVDTLEAALWAFNNTETFKTGALLAVNLGGDADTIGAVYGQLAGAYYGYEGLPKEWLKQLSNLDTITKLSKQMEGFTRMGEIMSVAEARKLLDNDEKYTDEQVAEMVNQLDFIAGMAIESYKKSLIDNAG